MLRALVRHFANIKPAWLLLSTNDDGRVAFSTRERRPAGPRAPAGRLGRQQDPLGRRLLGQSERPQRTPFPFLKPEPGV